MYNPKNFLIIGNGGSGTSLLRGLINAHPDIKCEFEMKPKHIEQWGKEAEAYPLHWGNKAPIEQFITYGFTEGQMIDLIEEWKVIFIIRRFSMYHQNRFGPYQKNWDFGRRVYWGMRERYPDRIIQISFEDLLLRTEIELMRICAFLEVPYNTQMIEGTKDTGYKKYNQPTINEARV